MLLTIFSILLLLAIFFIVLGFSIDESSFQIVGFTFLFILSTSILAPGNLEYKIGFNETFIYGDNYDGYHYDNYNGTINKGDLNLFHTSRIDVYAKADSSSVIWLGRWLSIISALGIVLSILNIRSWIRKGREDD